MKILSFFTALIIISSALSTANAEKNKGRSKVEQSPFEATVQPEAGQPADPALAAKIVEAEAHLKGVQNLFKEEKGLEPVFHVLNNQTSTNNQGQVDNEQKNKTLTIPANGLSCVKCIMNSNWAVTGTGKDVGTSAATWVSADGKSILPQMIAALAGGKDVARISVPTSVKSPIGGAPIGATKEIVVASSKYFGMDNSGQKFLCFVEVSS